MKVIKIMKGFLSACSFSFLGNFSGNFVQTNSVLSKDLNSNYFEMITAKEMAFVKQNGRY
jgi:hypothetical protein